MSVSLVCDDSFTHADTSFGSGSNSTTGVPTTGGTSSGWIDKLGSDFKIVSNQVNAKNNSGGSGVTPGILRRPTSEDCKEQEIITYGPLYSIGDDQRSGIAARIQSNGDCYILEVLQGYTVLYKTVSGSQTNIQSLTAWNIGSWTTGHNYECDFYLSAPSSGTTTMSYTITDTTSSTVVATGSGLTDNQSGLQNAGGLGLAVWQNGVNNTYIVTRVQTYAGALDRLVSATTTAAFAGVGVHSGTFAWSVSASTTANFHGTALTGQFFLVSAASFMYTNGWDLPASVVSHFPKFLAPDGSQFPWRQCVDDSFHNTTGSTNGPPFNNISVPTSGGTWSDYLGSTYRLGAGGPGFTDTFNQFGYLWAGYNPGSAFVGTAPNVGPFLGRPQNEDSAQQWVIVTTEYFPCNPVSPYYGSLYGNRDMMSILLRYNRTNGACYHLEFTSDGIPPSGVGGAQGYVSLAKFFGYPLSSPASATILSNDRWSASYTADQYNIQVLLTGPVAGVSTFTIIVSHATSGAVVYRKSVADSDTRLVSPGAFLLASVKGVGAITTGGGLTIPPGTPGSEFSVQRIQSYIPFVPTIFPESGSAAVSITDHGVKFDVGPKFVSASTAIVSVGIAREIDIGNKFASGLTAILVTPTNYLLAIGSKFLSATTSIGLREPALEHMDKPSTGIPDRVIVWGEANAYASPIHLSLSGVFVMTDEAEVLRVGNRILSARTHIVLSDAASSPTNWHIAAVTSIAIKTPASYIDNKAIHVSASTNMSTAGLALFHLTGPCGATTSMGISGHAGFPVFDRALAAKTGFVMVGAGFTRFDKMMFARTQVSLFYSAGENADLIVSAASSLATSGPVRKNMDWHLVATTSLATGVVDTHAPLYAPAGTGHIAFSDHATKLLTGTLVGNTITIVDVARVNRVLAWRPSVLTLPAGGFSPHA